MLEEEKPSPTPEGGGDEITTEERRQYVSFFLGEECLAFPMETVLEIIRLPPVVTVPKAPGSLLGLSNLRGLVLPILDLRGSLGLGIIPPSEATRVIVTDCGSPVGLVVDRVARVLNVDPDDIEEATELSNAAQADLLQGVVKGGESDPLIQLLDPRHVVWEQFSEVNRARDRLQEASGSDRLAGRNEGDDEGREDDSTQLVTFVISEQEYSFEISEVAEIVRVPPHITAVPQSGSHVLGLMNLRGSLLPLVCLRRMFHLPSAPLADHNRVVVVHTQERGVRTAIGVVVDQVREVVRIPNEVKDPMPSLLQRQGEGDAIIAVCRLEKGKRLLSILSAQALFQHTRAHLPEGTQQERDMIDNGRERSREEEEETQLVVFQLAGQEYGVAVETVQEITRVPDQITAIPQTPGFIEGMINLRGTVLPVIDMRQRFGLTRQVRNDRQRILVLNTRGARTGFIMDSVTEVLRLPRSIIEAAPPVSAHQEKLMGRIANLKESRRMIQVLDVSSLLDADEQGAIAALAA